MSQGPNEIAAFLEKSGHFGNLERITEGAQAYSFIGKHRTLGRDVFVKVYDYIPEDAGSCLREPQLLVRATSGEPTCENLVPIFDARIETVNGSMYLVMQTERVIGTSLLTLLETRPIGQQEAIRICLGIAHGVAHLHGHNLVHRDLKPANVMLEGMVARLTDFGSVVEVDATTGAATGSKHSALYAPPEALAKPSTYFKTSDVYQVGMVLYELVNGPLEVSGEHYVLPAFRQRLVREGTPYDKMQDFEKSKAQDDSMRRLALKRELLGHGRVARPYVSKKVRRLVRQSTDPVAALRPTALDLEYQLSSIAVPDWRPVQGGFEALDWRSADWLVSDTGEIKRRVGSASFRRYSNLGVPSTLAEAFELIESA